MTPGKTNNSLCMFTYCICTYSGQACKHHVSTFAIQVWPRHYYSSTLLHQILHLQLISADLKMCKMHNLIHLYTPSTVYLTRQVGKVYQQFVCQLYHKASYLSTVWCIVTEELAGKGFYIYCFICVFYIFYQLQSLHPSYNICWHYTTRSIFWWTTL